MLLKRGEQGLFRQAGQVKAREEVQSGYVLWATLAVRETGSIVSESP